MATVSWVGGAPAVAQVNTWTFATDGTLGDVITVTIGFKSWTYTTTSGTIATFLPLFLIAINALDATLYPEFAEITWTNPTTSTIVGTSAAAGKPFTATLATNSAGTTINGGASSTGTATTASKGPKDISTAGNYSGGAVPSAADTLILDRKGIQLLYGLSSQSGVLLAVRRILAPDIIIGLPETNADATEYPEYRATYWQQTATSDYISTSSTRIKLNHGTGQTTCTQVASGTGEFWSSASIPAVLLKGTHASNAFNILGGQAGFAVFTGETTTVNVGKIGGGATVICGSGVTNNTWNNYGGTLVLNSAIVTALNHPSTSGSAVSNFFGTGALAQLTMQGGRCNYNSTGTLGGTTVLGGSSALSFDGDSRAKAVTNPISIYSSAAQFLDSNSILTGGFTLKYFNCVPTPKLNANSQIVVTAL